MNPENYQYKGKPFTGPDLPREDALAILKEKAIKRQLLIFALIVTLPPLFALFAILFLSK